MFIRINSSNSNFSRLISKNPESPPKISKIRKGFGIGCYDKEDYCLVFIDAHDEVSFQTNENESFEYLSRTQYSSAACALSLLKTFFTKLNTEYDEVNTYKIVIKSLDISPSLQKALSSSFSDSLSVERISISDNFVELACNYHSTFTEALASVETILSLVLVKSNESIFIDDGMTNRVLTQMGAANPPYFIKYLLKCHLIKSSKKFKQYEKYFNTESQKFTHGWLFQQRLDFGISHIVGNSVLDVGCGEGRYCRRSISKAGKYFGVDIDAEVIDNNLKKFKNDEGASFSTKIPDEDFDTIICSEVIEHMPINNAQDLVAQLLNKNPAKLIVTTPNAAFNKHYPSLDDFRHDDHNWEASAGELKEILPIVDNYSMSYFYIGDIVDGESPTQAVVYERIK